MAGTGTVSEIELIIEDIGGGGGVGRPPGGGDDDGSDGGSNDKRDNSAQNSERPLLWAAFLDLDRRLVHRDGVGSRSRCFVVGPSKGVQRDAFNVRLIGECLRACLRSS